MSTPTVQLTVDPYAPAKSEFCSLALSEKMPALALATLRGRLSQQKPLFIHVDATGHSPEWVDFLLKAIPLIPKQVPHHVLLQVTEEIYQRFAPKEAPVLANGDELLPRADTASGFNLWSPRRGDSEEPLARLLLRDEATLNFRWTLGGGARHFKRPEIDNLLDEILREQRSLILVGHPFSGKTHHLRKALVRRGEAVWVMDPEASSWELPDDKVPLVLDDAQELWQPGRSRDRAIQFLLETCRNRPCLLTCRSGTDYQQLSEALHPRIELFQDHLVTRLSPEEAEQFAKQFQLPKHRTIGHAYAANQVRVWEKAYEHLDVKQQTLLKSLGQAYRLGIETDRVPVRTIRLLASHALPSGPAIDAELFGTIQRSLDERLHASGWYQETPGTDALPGLMLEPFFLDSILDREHAWAGLDSVLQVMNKLGLPTLQEHGLWKNALHMQRWAEQVRLNTPLESEALEPLEPLLEVIQSDPTQAAMALITLARLGSKAFTQALIKRTPKVPHSRISPQVLGLWLRDQDHPQPFLLPLARHLGVEVNVIHFNTLIAKAATPADARRLFDDMKAAGITPDVVTYGALIAKAATPADAHRLFNDMKAAGITPDDVTFNTLIAKAATPADARRLFDDMKAAGITPDDVTFNTLIAKTATPADARRLFDDMKAAGITPDVVTYGALIAKAATPADARRLFDDMKAAGITPDVVTYGALIAKAATPADARRLFDDMKAAGITPDDVTFNTLIAKAATPADAEAYFREALQAGIPPDTYTLQALVKKAPTYAMAASWIDTFATTYRVQANVHVIRAIQRKKQPQDDQDFKARVATIPTFHQAEFAEA